MIRSLYTWFVSSFGVGRSCVKTERCSSMVVVSGTSYIELRECWPLGLFKSKVSVFNFTCDVWGCATV